MLFHSNQFRHTVDGVFPVFVPDSKRVLQGLSYEVSLFLNSYGKAVKIIKMFL